MCFNVEDIEKNATMSCAGGHPVLWWPTISLLFAKPIVTFSR